MDFLLLNFSNIGNAIGWALIHFLWQGSLLFISYWIITRMLLNNKIKIQYWLGMLFVVMSLIVPIREFILQIANNSSYSNNVIHQIGAGLNPLETSGILSSFDMFILLIQKFIPYLVIFWMLSVLLISTHLIKSWLFLVKLGKDTSLKLPENLAFKLQQATEKLKLKFKPVISISKKIDVPATFGFFKPVILLPTSIVAKLPQDQMEAILLHELCHIKRADFLHNILQLLVETLFFYHPLVRWISKDVRRLREQCCDEMVLKLNNNPLVYAKALTNIATIYNNNIYSKKTTSNIQIAATDGELYKRIKFLMIEKRSKSQFTNLFLGFFITVLALLTLNNIININSIKSLSIFSSSSQSSSTIKLKDIDRPSYSIPNINKLISDSEESNFQKQKLARIKEIKSLELAKSKIVIDQAFVNNVDEIKKTHPENEISTVFTPRKNIDKPTHKTENTELLTKNTDVQENSYPKIKRKVMPIYSKIARAQGIEGTVILSFSIDRKGRVKHILVDKSSPLKLLDGGAKQALHKWRFDPKSINDHNLKNRYQQIFSFNLNETNLCNNGELGSRLSSKLLCQEL